MLPGPAPASAPPHHAFASATPTIFSLLHISHSRDLTKDSDGDGLRDNVDDLDDDNDSILDVYDEDDDGDGLLDIEVGTTEIEVNVFLLYWVSLPPPPVVCHSLPMSRYLPHLGISTGSLYSNICKTG